MYLYRCMRLQRREPLQWKMASLACPMVKRRYETPGVPGAGKEMNERGDVKAMKARSRWGQGNKDTHTILPQPPRPCPDRKKLTGKPLACGRRQRGRGTGDWRNRRTDETREHPQPPVMQGAMSYTK